MMVSGGEERCEESGDGHVFQKQRLCSAASNKNKTSQSSSIFESFFLHTHNLFYLFSYKGSENMKYYGPGYRLFFSPGFFSAFCWFLYQVVP
jgi:hypothetical protein